MFRSNEMTTMCGKLVLIAGVSAHLAGALPMVSIASAQDRDDRRQEWRGDDRPNRGRCDYLEGRELMRCERDMERRHDDRRAEEERRRRDWEDKKRKDAKTKGVVAGVVGTAVAAGIIAAIVSDSNKKKKEKKERDRRAYCTDRYGNYDDRTDSYRTRDGRWERCE